MKVFDKVTGIAIAAAAFATAGILGAPISSAETVPCTKGAQTSLWELRENTPTTDEVLKYYQSAPRRAVFDKLVGCIGTQIRDQLDPATIVFAPEDLDNGNGWAFVYAEVPDNKYVDRVTLLARVKNGIVALAETPRMFTLRHGTLGVTVHANAVLSQDQTRFHEDAPTSYSWSVSQSRMDFEGNKITYTWFEEILSIGVNNAADDRGSVTFDYNPLDLNDPSLSLEVMRAALDTQKVTSTTDAIDLDRNMVDRLESMGY